jgi:phosphoglycolate phosphatase
MAAIIFDFDGTIADSFDYVADFLASSAGKPKLTDDQKQALRGLSMLAMARQLGFKWWRLPSLFFKGRNRMGLAIKYLKPFKGLPELLNKLHLEGHELFILSTNSLHNVHRFLHQHDLHQYFLEVYGGVGLFSKAPALKKLLSEQKIELKNAIYVGDELRDVEAAQSIDLRIVAVTWGFASMANLKDKKPTALADNPTQLLGILEEI